MAFGRQPRSARCLQQGHAAQHGQKGNSFLPLRLGLERAHVENRFPGHWAVAGNQAIGALFLRDLADKTRRGMRGRVVAGKSGGGRSYGYRVVRKIDAGGVATDEREIDTNEAEIVRRIFRD